MNKPLIDAIGLFLAIIPFSLAQTATSVIRGTIQDRTSAVLIPVHVTLRDETRNQVWEQTTNEEGIFEFRALPFGNYRVEVEHPHFKKEVIENIATPSGANPKPESNTAAMQSNSSAPTVRT